MHRYLSGLSQQNQKGKISRDNESAEMLDLIYQNIRLDLTFAMAVSGLPIDSTMREVVIGNKTQLASIIESKRPACEKIIHQNSEKILAHDH